MNACIEHTFASYTKGKEGFVLGGKACVGEIALNLFNSKYGRTCGNGTENGHLLDVGKVLLTDYAD